MHSAQILDIFSIFSQKPHVSMDIFLATFVYLAASSAYSHPRCDGVRPYLSDGPPSPITHFTPCPMQKLVKFVGSKIPSQSGVLACD
jgi:hypothetical protein